MSWLGKILPERIRTETAPEKKTTGVPEGVWDQCPECGAALYRPQLEKNSNVCPMCDHHLRIRARRRLALFLDKDHQHEIGTGITPVDMLKFKDTKP